MRSPLCGEFHTGANHLCEARFVVRPRGLTEKCRGPCPERRVRSETRPARTLVLCCALPARSGCCRGESRQAARQSLRPSRSLVMTQTSSAADKRQQPIQRLLDHGALAIERKHLLGACSACCAARSVCRFRPRESRARTAALPSLQQRHTLQWLQKMERRPTGRAVCLRVRPGTASSAQSLCRSSPDEPHSKAGCARSCRRPRREQRRRALRSAA